MREGPTSSAERRRRVGARPRDGLTVEPRLPARPSALTSPLALGLLGGSIMIVGVMLGLGLAPSRLGPAARRAVVGRDAR